MTNVSKDVVLRSQIMPIEDAIDQLLSSAQQVTPSPQTHTRTPLSIFAHEVDNVHHNLAKYINFCHKEVSPI